MKCLQCYFLTAVEEVAITTRRQKQVRLKPQTVATLEKNMLIWNICSKKNTLVIPHLY